jgi:hypothetical protein
MADFSTVYGLENHQHFGMTNKRGLATAKIGLNRFKEALSVR